MNFVQPIRDPEKIRQIKDYLLSKSERNYILFVLGINTGLRITDILDLKVKDVTDTHIRLREQKTKKQKRLKITPKLRRELKWYTANKDPEEYLFASRVGKNKPISRSMAYKILKDAANQTGLKEIGTHTLRKTFGYQFYLQKKDVAMLQEILNHSSPNITRRYIGIHQDSMDKAMSTFSI